jgi:hypothetical protein
VLNRRIAALLLPVLLLLPAEHEAAQRSNVFNIPLLASRLQLAVEWMQVTGKLPAEFPVGFFGASTGESPSQLLPTMRRHCYAQAQRQQMRVCGCVVRAFCQALPELMRCLSSRMHWQCC